MPNLRLTHTLRQSAAGLLVLFSVGLFIYLAIWLRGFKLGGGSFQFLIRFADVGGMQAGTTVAYRGVRIGEVTSVDPQPLGVDVQVEVKPGDLLIPSNVLVEANQAGLIGETGINIVPLQDLIDPETIIPPLDPNCDNNIIICNGAQLEGQARLDINQLIRSMLRISNILSSTEFVSNLNSVTRNASITFLELSDLSAKVEALIDERTLSKTLASIDVAASDFSALASKIGGVVNEDTTLGSIQTAATEITTFLRTNGDTLGTLLTSLEQAASSVSQVLDTNREQLLTTLASIQSTSEQLGTTLKGIDPVLGQVNEGGELLENLNVLSRDAAELVENLKDFSVNINDPATLILLREVLDSARSSFQNLNKITSDVDELTGDPELRRNLRHLIEAMNQLLSSTEQLDQQIQLAQTLSPLADDLKLPLADTKALIDLASSEQSTTSSDLKSTVD
ncbi:MAG: MlaD family protein [Cyanobacteria bacterium P01_H01_bin.15]